MFIDKRKAAGADDCPVKFPRRLAGKRPAVPAQFFAGRIGTDPVKHPGLVGRIEDVDEAIAIVVDPVVAQLDGHQGYRPRLARSRRARPRGSALRWSLPYLLAGIANVMYGNVISLPAITGVGTAKDTAGIVLRYATTARASSLDSRA